ncbi:hypothetical protein N431DRAFT_440551 [Stipitochalara longipes BDJ]|nr:hypothetical protein N431DRAFT_440551 [Stipitochalara longipes BDJ]
MGEVVLPIVRGRPLAPCDLDRVNGRERARATSMSLPACSKPGRRGGGGGRGALWWSVVVCGGLRWSAVLALLGSALLPASHIREDGRCNLVPGRRPRACLGSWAVDAGQWPVGRWGQWCGQQWDTPVVQPTRAFTFTFTFTVTVTRGGSALQAYLLRRIGTREHRGSAMQHIGCAVGRSERGSVSRAENRCLPVFPSLRILQERAADHQQAQIQNQEPRSPGPEECPESMPSTIARFGLFHLQPPHRPCAPALAPAPAVPSHSHTRDGEKTFGAWNAQPPGKQGNWEIGKPIQRCFGRLAALRYLVYPSVLRAFCDTLVWEQVHIASHRYHFWRRSSKKQPAGRTRSRHRSGVIGPPEINGLRNGHGSPDDSSYNPLIMFIE